MEIRDLDLLRPESMMIKIGGKEIDVSFVPTGVTFEVNEIINELQKIDPKKIMKDIKLTHKAFDLGIKLCSVYCEHKYPEMTEKWFKENTTAGQINVFVDMIKTSLQKSFEGIEAHAKN